MLEKIQNIRNCFFEIFQSRLDVQEEKNRNKDWEAKIADNRANVI